MENKQANSIFTIAPYRYYGGWVFDDERVGLDKEAFVAGADILLDRIAGKRIQVTAIFSEIPFPDHELKLVRKGGEIGMGTDYFCEELQQDLWLCPALGKYFDKSPETIYLKIK